MKKDEFTKPVVPVRDFQFVMMTNQWKSGAMDRNKKGEVLTPPFFYFLLALQTMQSS
ncbi:hypothetical protein [Bdellovibrio bacteriovorus]|uniref:hypothetical protein n=1 Tax=Bdellovibrio bacteriovorus TaxID=959 RepID=UPI0035A6871D